VRLKTPVQYRENARCNTQRLDIRLSGISGR
jgi:hypothetical protein